MAGREFIHTTPRLQPGKEVSRRDYTALAEKVHELSRQIAAEERPHLSSRFIENEEGDTSVTIDLVAFDSDGNANLNGVVHGLGRKYRGWHPAGKTGPGDVWEAPAADIASYNVDTTVYLPLYCSQDVTVRLIVF